MGETIKKNKNNPECKNWLVFFVCLLYNILEKGCDYDEVI